MKTIGLAFALAAALAPTLSFVLPKQQVRPCSAAEWIWDTLVQDIGCTLP